MDHNAELKEFLRTRRARLRVDDVELGGSGRVRRVPGLRREEVAQLAGVSVDYYTRLEQGRHLNVSDEVLDAVARALRLDDVERAYLFEIARRRTRRARRRPAPVQRVRPGVRRILETLDDITPAFVFGRRMDLLAANRLAKALMGDFLAKALMGDFDALPPRERNLMRFTFLDETARELFADWEQIARDNVAVLRLDAGRHPDDPLLAELVGELAVKSEEFRRWWADHNVRERTHGTKHYHHPLVGDLTVNYEAVPVAGDPDQTLCIYTTEPGSPSETAMRLLANWTGAPAADAALHTP
ncbi:putative transcriptional regulator [Mycolicibacterium phlei]|jgi:transcriptional regulator with XRE-family HTH domain|nr:helix-turn-helix transcriptional regulator [Mycolicibacterium phlei]VEG11867.1 putative transcriptional regulator [Mycobacteroides chelonae]AMO63776.1 helix-turn-helix protein [Mycolicibacterium phlei]KXW61742.1 XRE family transcriptional regulator [Mycolicibacterium phlei DSM 43070]KXW64567.1 XRE family transcriptional regulator [Mycolicibacterium phlei DSM 43072]STZ22231.1 putative transcriptional regulator [Mycolicibacterium phlei]